MIIKSKKAAKFLDEVIRTDENNKNNVGMPYRYCSEYNSQIACDMAYDEGFETGKQRQRLVKSVSKDGLPSLNKNSNVCSVPCLCFVPGDIHKGTVDNYLVAYYHYKIDNDPLFNEAHWVCHQTGGLRYLEVEYYVELPDFKGFCGNE